MGTITYGDKVFINENPDVADINKVKDSDMNEIKTAVNDNDSNITGLKGAKLWTNSSPNSTMASTSVTLSSGDYDYLEVFYKSAYNQTNCSSVRIEKGYGAVMIGYSVNFTSAQYYMRAITYTDDTHITFEGGYAVSTSKTSNNGVCIPLYVIGYKV